MTQDDSRVVARYQPSGYSVGMHVHPEGRWVDWCAYVRLQSLLAEAESRLVSNVEVIREQEAKIDALQAQVDAVRVAADKCATWLPDGNDPIGPLHGAGMAFAYRDAAKLFRAALGETR